jgi:hypothetical protein
VAKAPCCQAGEIGAGEATPQVGRRKPTERTRPGNCWGPDGNRWGSNSWKSGDNPQSLENHVPLCGTNRIRGTRKSATMARDRLTAVSSFRPAHNQPEIGLTHFGVSCGKTATATPPDRARPDRSLEEFAYGCGKVEAVRTSRAPACLSADQWNCTDVDRRCGRRASRLRDSGACWTRLHECVPAHTWTKGKCG